MTRTRSSSHRGVRSSRKLRTRAIACRQLSPPGNGSSRCAARSRPCASAGSPFRCGRSVQVAVVALTQAPVEQDRRGSGGEGDVGGLDSPAKVGAEHGRDPVVLSSFTELAGLPAPSVGEAAVAPPRGNAELVVLADRVRLEDDGDRHAPDSTGRLRSCRGSLSRVVRLRRGCPTPPGSSPRRPWTERRSSGHRRCRGRRARCRPGPRRRGRRAASR